MAEPTKADLAGPVERRLRTVERNFAKAQGAAGTLKTTVVIASAAVFTAIASLVGYLFYVQSHVSTNGEAITGIRTQITELKSQHLVDLSRIEKTTEKLDTRVNQIAQGGPIRGMAGADDSSYDQYVGKISSVAPGVITLEERQGSVLSKYAFETAEGVRVLIKGKTGKWDDLKPGMIVRLLFLRDGKVDLIRQEDEKKAIPPPRG